jgi:hypothetical protein
MIGWLILLQAPLQHSIVSTIINMRIPDAMGLAMRQAIPGIDEFREFQWSDRWVR